RAAIAHAGPGRLRMIGECRGLGQTKDVRPLLDLLTEVREPQRGVVGAMPELHARASAGEAGEGRAHEVAPLLRSLDRLTIGTRGVPQRPVGGDRKSTRLN